MAAYYNEINPFCAQWLRNLMAAGHIADGEVDTRSITEVQPEDLTNFTQCHFFAGLGGWSHALRLSGWPDDRPVWTGSCPCQPFSVAGKKKGFTDDRHLWPIWFRLIQKQGPPVIFGEQVASKDGLTWFDLVSSDLEGSGYATGAFDLCAAGVGAPHIRQRLYFVAESDSERRNGEYLLLWEEDRGRTTADILEVAWSGAVSNWTESASIWCSDGKYRIVEPGTFPLANGVPNRVGTLRAYGNAIVPQVASALISSYLGK